MSHGKIVKISNEKQTIIVLDEKDMVHSFLMSQWQESFPPQLDYEVEYIESQWIKYHISQPTDRSESNQINSQKLYDDKVENTNDTQISTLQADYSQLKESPYKHGIFGSYVLGWKNAFNYNGRARRKEYWYFQIAALVIAIPFVVGIAILSLAYVIMASNHDYQFERNFGRNFDIFFYSFLYIFIVIFSLIHAIPSISLFVRRLHDINKSGWLVLLCCIPYIGGIAALIFGSLDTYPKKNQWGLPNKYKVD